MEPVMKGVKDIDTRKGDVVIGATLVLTGLAIVLDRTGVFQWRDQWTLWPIILGGLGLARFLQSPPGEPKQGLLLLTAAAWLLLGQAGVVSIADGWPFLIIAIGIIVALNGGRRRRWRMAESPGHPADPMNCKHPHRPARSLSPLGILGVWIAVFVALQVSGVRSFRDATADNRVRVVSVIGRSQHISPAVTFRGADVTNVMGRSELDLRDATVAPGEDATVQVFSAMGTVVMRVPSTWTVDTGAISALGTVRDERIKPLEAEAPADPAPRLVLRGLVMFGRLTVTS
jgi:hypothetical protein